VFKPPPRQTAETFLTTKHCKNLRKNGENNANDYLPFIENFIFTLLICYKELDMRFVVINSKKVSKRERIEQTMLINLSFGKRFIFFKASSRLK